MTFSIARWGLVLAAALSAGAWAPVRQSRETWLPAGPENELVRQLAERMTAIPVADGVPITETVRRDRARQAVRTLRGVFDAWGLEGTLARAPKLAGVPVPASSNRLLDAMGRYQLCTFVLALQIAPEHEPSDFNLRFTGVMGMTATTMAVVYLRQPFVAAGGTAEAMEAHMTSDAMEALGARLQREPDLLARAQNGCAPVVIEMLTKIVG